MPIVPPAKPQLIFVLKCPGCGSTLQRAANLYRKPIDCRKCRLSMQIVDQYHTIGRARRFYGVDGEDAGREIWIINP